MIKSRHEEVRNWLKQARADFAAVQDSLKTEHYEWACFQAQQAAEKALKALYIHRKRTSLAVHNLLNIAQSLRTPRDVVEAARELNADYVTARYPDAANGVPARSSILGESPSAISGPCGRSSNGSVVSSDNAISPAPQEGPD